jgi:hypothetical protein
MGWLDYHLHQFTIPHPRTKQARIFGIHNLSQDCDDPPSWEHSVRLVEVLRHDFKLRYPRCRRASLPAG